MGNNSKPNRIIVSRSVLPLLVVAAVSLGSPALALNQPPDSIIGFWSDPTCECLIANGGAQSTAENFVLTSSQRMSSIRVWGGYFSQASGGQVPPALDDFTVIFHDDLAGLPGGVANGGTAMQAAVPATRVATGGIVLGFINEYVFDLDITDIDLAPGLYWVEIFNESTADDWFWETGFPDFVNGLPNSVIDISSGSVPGSIWTLNTPSQELAIQLISTGLGACCTNGPGIESECIVTTEDDCLTNEILYLGDGSDCSQVEDCVVLAVTLESMSAQATSAGVQIQWATAIEVDTVGFRVLRETAGQRQAKTLDVVSPLIYAGGDSLSGKSYEFLDNSNEARSAVRYYLEDIDINGKVTRHGPIEVKPGWRVRDGGEGRGRTAPSAR